MSLAQLHQEMRACRRCADAGYDIVPGAVFRGRRESQVLLIGQAPGVTEVEAKRPFNAGSGRRLFQWLALAGWEENHFRDTHYMTAVTKCYPGKAPNGKGDRVPSRAEQALCRPFLEREIAIVNPRVVLLVGKLAISLVYPKSAKLKDIIGSALYLPEHLSFLPDPNIRAQAQPIQQYSGQKNGRFVVPVPHPSGASLWPNKPENKALIGRSMALLDEIRNAWKL
ncbi:MAG: uracil-DNA glycosylase family protein [Ardenticatenaceae bacterium]|nr:uracil-DNA glycosylase family protein [Ardenticatenaceae bacterium]